MAESEQSLQRWRSASDAVVPLQKSSPEQWTQGHHARFNKKNTGVDECRRVPPAALLKMLLVLEATRMELSVRVTAVWVLRSAAHSCAVMGVLLVEKAGLLQQCPSLRHVPVPAPGHIPMICCMRARATS